MTSRTPQPLRPAALLLMALVASGPAAAVAAEVGDQVEDLELRDASNKPARIPDLGQKVLAIFYNDADEADLNDPLADALKARKFDVTRYRGVGIANLADSKAPNFIIRKIVRGKIAKYKSTILTDPNRSVARAWRLGDCNNTSVFVLLGKDGRVQYVRRGAIRGAEIDEIVALVARLVEDG